MDNVCQKGMVNTAFRWLLLNKTDDPDGTTSVYLTCLFFTVHCRSPLYVHAVSYFVLSATIYDMVHKLCVSGQCFCTHFIIFHLNRGSWIVGLNHASSLL